MSDSSELKSQYATSKTLNTRRGLYDTNIGVSLTDRLAQELQLDSAESFLDVGCGYGADIAKFTQLYPKLQATGFDPSEAQINDARSKTPGAKFLLGDLETIDLSDQFDRVLVRHVLHLTSDPVQALNRILTWVKPGGRVVFAIHSSKSQPKFAAWRKWFEDQTGISYSAPSDKLTLEKNRDLFEKPGYQTTFIEAVETISLTDAEPYLNYIKSQKRWSREPTPEELNDLYEHVRKSIDTEIKTRGTFEDLSINGIVVMESRPA